jgi:hypothetical protein
MFVEIQVLASIELVQVPVQRAAKENWQIEAFKISRLIMESQNQKAAKFYLQATKLANSVPWRMR